ncbi:hypothetical protein E8E12_008366 [Didymella heteroderae]|uniref:Fungal STAND N-terminal Goodbye domain-containing protein n=1 Tax=Didymella heteroderae TaxID=1769908 RepID=A0A9P4WTH1_9PLEO|nr:hypothetical protein E8E12_008366 [Didymella heteroderae]
MGRGHDEPEIYFDEDKDLHEVWPQVVLQYEKITKQKLDSKTTFKSFQARIDQEISNSKSKGHEHARQVLRNMGTCLETFGSIVAQGASIVFGPASQCWNAISFVVQAARGFGDVLDGFVTLMERSSAFLKQLNNFLEQKRGEGEARLPRNLREPAYGMLTLFLGVLQNSYELATSKRERFKTMMGIVLFNDDRGVAQSLELLELRIKDFTNASIQEILFDVKGLALHLRESEEEMNRHQGEIREYLEATYKVTEEVLSVTQQMKLTIDGRTTKEQYKEDKDKIAKSLALQKAGETESWDKRHSELCKSHIEGTGKWLERDEGFVQWSDVNNHNKQVFVLKADSGFGKTYASNHVISHLQKKYRSGSGSKQVYLAYYYYGDDKDESLERCIGSIIYQFAAAHVGYATAVASACGQTANVARAEDRWEHLVLGLSSHMKGTYFICIDGFDSRGQLDKEEATIASIARRAMAKADGSGISIRLFLSGNSEALARVPQPAEGLYTITLGASSDSSSGLNDDSGGDGKSSKLPLNASDLEVVTRYRVMELCKAEPDLKEFLTEPNIKLLIEGIRGNYNHLEAKITEINSCETERQVQDVIKNTSVDMDRVQRDRLKGLDVSLSTDQVKKLNELLVWVAGVSNGATIKFLQSALYLTFRENFRLESEIRNTYSALLKTDEDGVVTFKSDELIRILRENDSKDPESDATGLHNEDISLAEIDLCRRFIKNACDSVDYSRFKFDDFFDNMAHKAHLHLGDESSVNFTVFTSCIDVLSEDANDANLEKLRDYASIWFYEHLKTLVENLESFEPNRQSLSATGRKLIDLFYSPERIDAWFSKGTLGALKYDWLYRDDFFEPLTKFWKNPHVAKGYAKDPEKSLWVKKVTAESTNRYIILERVATRLAEHWFNCTGTLDEEYLWISFGLVAKGAGKTFEDKAPSLPEIDQFFAWVKDHHFEIDDQTWAYRKGATYLVFEHHREAIREYESVGDQSERRWGVVLGMSRAHAQLKEYKAALQNIRKFKSLKDRFFETDKEYKLAYWDVLLAEGNCNRQSHDYESAANCYKDILDQEVEEELWPGQVHTAALFGLFTTWNEMKNYRSIVDFMRGWKNATAKDRGPAYWLQKVAYDDNLHGHVATAAKHADAVDELCSLYQEVIDSQPSKSSAADEQDNRVSSHTRGQLQYYQAVLRFHGSHSQHDHLLGIQSWEEIVQKSDEPSMSWFTAYSASRRLARSLLDKAATENTAASLEISGSYVSRLETLAKLNNRVIRDLRQGQSDPRLCLLRLYRLRNDDALAFAEAQNRLCSVFDRWPEKADDDSLRLRYQNLAQTLTVLDKDVDAIAVWQAVKPETSQGAIATDTDANAADSQQSASTSPEVVQANGASVTPANSLNGTTDAPKAYISGYTCDGCYETQWRDMLADCWVCKNCLCVQLCPPCYEKLKADSGHPLVCNKEHKMLYLPPFDQDLWQSMSSDMVIVDKQSVSRVEWLNKIRDEYKVQQEQIDVIKIEKARELKAATCIAKHILRWRRRLFLYRAAKQARQSGPPPLRRAQTVR